MKKFLFVIGTLIILVACNNAADSNKGDKAKGDEVTQLKKEVMEAHDITMAQMNTMNKLKKALKEKWQNEDVTDTTVYYQSYADLQKAHDRMMDWMAYFSKNYDDNNMETEAKKKFLVTEKEKIIDLAKFTDESIAEAKQLLAE